MTEKESGFDRDTVIVPASGDEARAQILDKALFSGKSLSSAMVTSSGQ